MVATFNMLEATDSFDRLLTALPNLPNQTEQTKPTKPPQPNIQSKTYPIKYIQLNIPNQVCLTKHTKPKTFYFKSTEPTVTKMNFELSLSLNTSENKRIQPLGRLCLFQC